MAFAIGQILSTIQTATLVRVDKCTNSGGLSPVGTVDVTPLVNQLDAAGTPTPHTTIHNVPYHRFQGGANAVIIDPVAGDIGICVFASRDISKVKSSKGQANPGSGRQYSFSDGLYIGGVLNAAPSQYVQFSEDGITLYSPKKITIEAGEGVDIKAPAITATGSTLVDGPLSQGTGAGGGGATMKGPLTVTEDVTAQGISLASHTHGGVTPGDGSTGGPQ